MYKTEFLDALENSQKCGIAVPKVELTDERYLNSSSLAKLSSRLQKEMHGMTEDELVATCLSIHLDLISSVEDIFGCKAYYTIGWVSGDGWEMFKQTRDSLESMLKQGIDGAGVNLHCWLTLPSLEILDFTLPTSYAKVNKTREGVGHAITMHYTELTLGMKYRPMIIGEDILFKSGAAKAI